MLSNRAYVDWTLTLTMILFILSIIANVVRRSRCRPERRTNIVP